MFDHASDPAELGFDADRLARLRPWMQAHVDAGRIPGAQVLVARRGRVVLHGWTGRMDVEGGRPWARDTLARVYSMTKPATSVALLMLYEDGLCRLDDPVELYIPELADRRVLRPDATRIDQTATATVRLTLHHLLTHTSGLTYGFNEGVLAEAMRDQGVEFGAPSGDLAETVRRLAGLPLAFEPGSRWNYGVSTDVLGRVVEVISGQTLDRFFAERIFGPLGMADTFFAVPADRAERLASCYSRTEGDGMALADPGRDSRFLDVRQFSGGGGLVSTADDYLRFAEMLRGRGALGPRAPAGAEDRRGDDRERAAGRHRLDGPAGLLRGAVRRHRLWPGRRRDARPRPRQDARQPRRFRLGRHGVDRLLGRSGARALHRLPDPADPVLVLSAAQGAARARLLLLGRALSDTNGGAPVRARESDRIPSPSGQG